MTLKRRLHSIHSGFLMQSFNHLICIKIWIALFGPVKSYTINLNEDKASFRRHCSCKRRTRAQLAAPPLGGRHPTGEIIHSSEACCFIVLSALCPTSHPPERCHASHSTVLNCGFECVTLRPRLPGRVEFLFIICIIIIEFFLAVVFGICRF